MADNVMRTQQQFCALSKAMSAEPTLSQSGERPRTKRVGGEEGQDIQEGTALTPR